MWVALNLPPERPPLIGHRVTEQPRLEGALEAPLGQPFTGRRAWTRSCSVTSSHVPKTSSNGDSTAAPARSFHHQHEA